MTVSRLITSHARSIVPAEHVEIYAANTGHTLHDLVLSLDARGYYAMNLLDYLVGNTDRHWGNWGFWVSNETNELLGLHPLMDFNRAFTAYDTVVGVVCQTALGGVSLCSTAPDRGSPGQPSRSRNPRRMSQKDAALEAVGVIGLPQTEEVRKEWFPEEAWWEMFRERMDVVKAEE